ncbi:hypothetical protein GCM10010214_56290 [Streptomyces abikoensis]|nr:hypothetical protein GCM10010214_56290 [Streptomyces abikoensis]
MSVVLVDRQTIVLWADMGAVSRAGIANKLRGTGPRLDAAPDATDSRSDVCPVRVRTP